MRPRGKDLEGSHYRLRGGDWEGTLGAEGRRLGWSIGSQEEETRKGAQGEETGKEHLEVRGVDWEGALGAEGRRPGGSIGSRGEKTGREH